MKGPSLLVIAGVVILSGGNGPVGTVALAQERSRELNFNDREGVTSVHDGRGVGNGAEGAGARANRGDTHNGGFQVSEHDQRYPALAQANRAYQQAIQTRQEAYRQYQEALNHQKAVRAKYVDENNNIRPGFDWAAATAVVADADKKAMDAWEELGRAERERNLAYSRVSEEFRKAVEQYNRELAAKRADEEAKQKSWNYQRMQSGAFHDK